MRNATTCISVQPSFAFESTYYLKSRSTQYPFSHFYQFQFGENTPKIVGIPDCAIDIIVECGSNPQVNVHGMVLNHWQFDQFKRNTTYFGARLLPGIVPPSWRPLISYPVQGVYAIDQFGFDTSLFHDIGEDADFHRNLEIFAAIFSSKQFLSPPSSLFKDLVDLIHMTGGTIPVRQLEEKSGFSTRYINKIFHKNAGMSPKTFCLVTKFQMALQAINRGEYVSLAELAYTFGYSDQSTFTRDFKKYSSYTPMQYVNMVEENNYAGIVHELG